MKRRLAIGLLLGSAAAVGYYLFSNVQESHLFKLSTTPGVSGSVSSAQVQQAISGSTVTSLTTISATNLLENPRYTGRDVQNRRWEVVAQRADQQGSTASGTIILSGVQANLENPQQEKTTPAQRFTMQAEEGEYSQSSNTLNLKGNVVLTGNDMVLTAPLVAANINSRTAVAKGGVRIQGTAGGWGMDITAPQGNVDQSSSRVNLTGGVRGRLTPQGNKE